MKVFTDVEGSNPDAETFRAPPSDGSEYIEQRPYVELPDNADLSTKVVDGGVLREMTPAELVGRAHEGATKQVLENRVLQYKPIAEQLDMQYWDRRNGTDTWFEHVQSVKDSNPKPD